MKREGKREEKLTTISRAGILVRFLVPSLSLGLRPRIRQGLTSFFAREILTLGLWSFGYYMILGQDVIRDQGMMVKYIVKT